jgi:CDP-diacylglycerol--glycerol-3-phosphate 3-phosphatidyltransferase
MSVSTLPESPHVPQRVLNVPNVLTLARLALAVILFALLAQHDWMFTSLILFIVAASTDWLDGYIARRRGETTTLGRILDPFVDKVVVIGAFTFLLGEDQAETGLAPWMVTVVIARELLVTGLRSYLEGESVAFGADWMGKIKMVLQCVAIGFMLFYLGVAKGQTTLFNQWSSYVLDWSERIKDLTLWVAIIVTVISGIAYSWRAAVLIRQRNLG